MPIVDYDKDNATKCRCVKCPVEDHSPCSNDKMQRIAQMGEETQSIDGARMPDPKMMPGLYCAETVGKSTCDDLNFSNSCICGTCLVHHEKHLGSGYYCREGSAEVNG